MKNKIKGIAGTYSILAVIAGAIVILDQLTKTLVRNNLEFNETWAPWNWIKPYARIIHWQNTGAAFGIFQNGGNVIMIISIIIVIAIIYFFPKINRKDWYLVVALSMQMGGAIGNLIDRFSRGWVTDFVSVGSFAVFNVADASISIGTAILLLGMWIDEVKRKKQREMENSSDMETNLGIEELDE